MKVYLEQLNTAPFLELHLNAAAVSQEMRLRGLHYSCLNILALRVQKF